MKSFVGNKAKWRTSKQVLQETKARQNFRNKHFLPPETHTYVCISGAKKCLFLASFGVLWFLETPVLRFALLPYSRLLYPSILKKILFTDLQDFSVFCCSG